MIVIHNGVVAFRPYAHIRNTVEVRIEGTTDMLKFPNTTQKCHIRVQFVPDSFAMYSMYPVNEKAETFMQGYKTLQDFPSRIRGMFGLCVVLESGVCAATFKDEDFVTLGSGNSTMYKADYIQFIESWLQERNAMEHEGNLVLQWMVLNKQLDNKNIVLAYGNENMASTIRDYEGQNLPMPKDLSNCFKCGKPAVQVPSIIQCTICDAAVFCNNEVCKMCLDNHGCPGMHVPYDRITHLGNFEDPPSCNTCGKGGTLEHPLKLCGRCKSKEVMYCCKDCQKTGWITHKASCILK